MGSDDPRQGHAGGVVVGLQRAQEKARVALFLLIGIVDFDPVAMHVEGTASTGETGTDGADGRDGGCADVDAPVLALGAYFKKGEPSRAALAALALLEVLAFVPSR